MSLPLLFVALVSFQIGQAPGAGVPFVPIPTQAPAPATSQAWPAAPAAPATGAPGRPQAPAIDPVEKFKSDTLKNLWALNVQKFGHEEWSFLGTYYGSRTLFVIFLMTLAWTLPNWSSSALRSTLARIKFDETLSIFLAKLLRWSVLLLVGMTCLGYFGIETTGFAAIIGAAGLAIGLAFQGTLSNFAAGAMLLIFRPYKVGDTVNVAGYSGKVDEIELFTTTIDTNDRRRVIIPNSSIYGTVIENITFHGVRRAEISVGAAYSADIDQTRAALERAVRSVSLVVSDPAPEIVLDELAASSVNWTVRGYARRDQFGDAKQAMLRAVKNELDHAGIGIPFPQLELHIDQPAAVVPRRVA
jgi:small conductance mechanosensitive channel